MKKVSHIGTKGKQDSGEGIAEVMSLARYGEQDLDMKVELIQSLIPLGLMHVAEVLEEEVTGLVGARYGRGEGQPGLARYGSNPGSVRIGGHRVPVSVPRVRNQDTNQEVSLESLRRLRGRGDVNDVLLRRVLYGLSCRNYGAAAESISGAMGLSSSTISRHFIEASAKQLRTFRERNLSEHDFVALLLDGKTFADDSMVIALGVTLDGQKLFLDFIQTGTENAKVLTPFLRGLWERGLRLDEGLLVVIDGAKGLRVAVQQAFRKQALVQRCQWHKRENVVRYLPKSEQESWRRRLTRAHEKPTYSEAKESLLTLREELEEKNLSAVASLDEGFEETLTLHKLGVFSLLGRSLKTTNCLESINNLIEMRCGKIKHWKNASQKHRWLAASLLDIEPRLRRINGYRHLPLLREALKEALGLQHKAKVA